MLNPSDAVHAGTFTSDEAAARVVKILGKYKINAVADASMVSFPDDQLIALRRQKSLVQALCYNAGAQRCDWAEYLEGRRPEGAQQIAPSQ